MLCFTKPNGRFWQHASRARPQSDHAIKRQSHRIHTLELVQRRTQHLGPCTTVSTQAGDLQTNNSCEEMDLEPSCSFPTPLTLHLPQPAALRVVGGKAKKSAEHVKCECAVKIRCAWCAALHCAACSHISFSHSLILSSFSSFSSFSHSHHSLF